MSVKRRDLIRYLEKNGFYLLREGGKHSIYTNEKKIIPVKCRFRYSFFTHNAPHNRLAMERSGIASPS